MWRQLMLWLSCAVMYPRYAHNGPSLGPGACIVVVTIETPIL